MKKINKIYIISLLILALSLNITYSTYALFTTSSTSENSLVTLESSSFILELEEIEQYRRINIKGNETVSLEFNITNGNTSGIYYGAWYEPVYPSSENTGLEVSYTGSNMTSLSSGTSTTMIVYITNTTDSIISINIGVKAFSDSNLTIDSPRYFITEVYTEPVNPQVLSDLLISKANPLSNQDYTTSTDEEKAEVYTFSHDATEQTTAQTDYRFIGSNPNNYVYYNCTDTDNQSADTCETWRILGVFPTDDGTGNIENRVKIVSGTGIAAVNTSDSSLQQTFSWDSSVSGTDGATTNYGINQWGPTTLIDGTTAYAGADLMQLLNEGAYYNRTTGDCYTSSSNRKITCDFNSSSTSIKTRGLSDSAKSVISTAQYYLGGGTTYNSTNHYGTGSDIYTWERGTTTYNGTDVARTTSWTGEVALMYPSDYVYSYAYGVDDTCYNDSYNCYTSTPTSGWIYNSNTKNGTTAIDYNWFLSPYSGNSYYVFYAVSAGFVYSTSSARSARLVRPVVYLESDIQSLRGDGSADSPYQLIY